MDSDSHADVSGGDQTDDLLARAVAEALTAGMSWAQIAAQLGVPPPSRPRPRRRDRSRLAGSNSRP
ncbi:MULTISPECIES: hypothetical protein [Rhodococcus]|uniref:hypothetical protein n=1 Tax=Rhodococcus TaxID=1827 RepID=UPI001ED9475B|nr:MULTISPECIES: hypothetical protein [Rhodococcus]